MRGMRRPLLPDLISRMALEFGIEASALIPMFWEWPVRISNRHADSIKPCFFIMKGLLVNGQLLTGLRNAWLCVGMGRGGDRREFRSSAKLKSSPDQKIRANTFFYVANILYY